MTKFYSINRSGGFHLQDHKIKSINTNIILDENNKPLQEAVKQMGFKLAEFLMEQVYALRWQNNRRAIEYGVAILNLGCGLKQKRLEARGFMSIGDTLALEGRHFKVAWKLLQQGAALFKEEQDELGWAMSTIGRTGICMEVNQSKRMLIEARQALNYFQANNYNDYYFRLCVSINKLYFQLGKYHDIIRLYKKARDRGKESVELWTKHMGFLANNTGMAYLNLGFYHEARHYFELALANLIQLGKHNAVLVVRGNIAEVERNIGNYRKALKQYHEIVSSSRNSDTIYNYRIKLDLIKCYLALNLDIKAKKLAQDLIDVYTDKDLDNLHDFADTLRLLGYAEAKLSHWADAEKQLIRSEQIFKSLKATAWSKQIMYLRARILLWMHNYGKALKLIRRVKYFFKAKEYFIQMKECLLIEAECHYKLGKYKKALKYCRKVLSGIGKISVPQLHYEAHLLAGKIWESKKIFAEAEKNYYSAFQCIEEWQKNLTITIKTPFLENKCEAFHRLMDLLLKKMDPGKTITLLERFRWSTLLGYMTNREQLYWSAGNEVTDNLLKQLQRLREEHFLYFRMSYERHLLANDTLLLDPEEAKGKLAFCEDKIRQLVEQLYLHSESPVYIPFGGAPPLKHIQQVIPDRAVLLAYYYHNNKSWVILIKQNETRLFSLDTTISSINELLNRFYFNIKCQLGCKDHIDKQLIHLFKQLSHRLYTALIHPCVTFLNEVALLYFVPFGLLSYVPFNILYDGKDYLINQYEITLLPSISLLLRKLSPHNKAGTVIAYSKEGRYPWTQTEASKIAQLFNCSLYKEDQATRDRLAASRGHVLHIATHGMHRPDQPDFSFIELADGQLFADDLIQMNLNYELVTLSGCETGQLSIKQGGDMIGLVRGALLAGAGSLVVSFWLVDDRLTGIFMKEFYYLLIQGKSKACALAITQRRLNADSSQYSPAQWGAFQLIGDNSPLSQINNKP